MCSCEWSSGEGDTGAEGEEDAQLREVPEQTEGLGPGAQEGVPAKHADGSSLGIGEEAAKDEMKSDSGPDLLSEFHVL